MNKLAVSVISAALLLSGCATVKGLGKDIQSVGEAGQKVVDAPKKK
jgi:predicted small secreted protein